MPLSVPVAKHTNFFWLLPSFPSALLAQLPHKGLPWFGSLNYILQLACPILVSAIIFPIVIVLPLWLLGNISHCLSTCAHGITQWALQKDCILPLTRVWCPSLLQMKWSLDPCFSQLFFHGQICLSVTYLNSFCGGIPKRMCALFVWLCFCECLFFSLWELVYTRNNIKWPHFSTPSSILNVSTQANANINHRAHISKITLKGHLQLSIAFYQWGNWAANMWKVWPMLHK